MAIFLKGKDEVQNYINRNGMIDVRSVSLSTLEYLLKVEHLTMEEIATLFSTTAIEVSSIAERNGL